ncbi:esterase/lipase family protein [Nocardioides marmoraquaticus]
MPTLIVPGAFTRASSFDRLAEALDGELIDMPWRDRRLAQLDLGGLGAADRALDQAVERVTEADRQSPLVLVGHSMGGLLALRASRRHPLDALVLLMPAPPRAWAPTSPGSSCAIPGPP